MTTHVDIVAEFDDRSVMVSANDLKRNVERTGDDTGKAWGQGFTRSAEGRLRDDRGRFVKVGQDLGGDVGKGMADGFNKELPRFKAGITDAVNSTRAFREEQQKLQSLMRSGAGWDDVIRQSERTANAHNLARTAARDAGDAFKEFENAGKSLANTSQGLMGALSDVGGALRGLSGVALPGAIIALGSAAVELAGVAASASQSLWLIPGAATAAGAAIGTVALATYGFGDALKAVGDPQKFAEALQQLSPNAQQAALSIQQLMPAFTQLRQATSDAFFANVGPQINQLTNQFLPTIQAMTTGIAGAFNQAFSGIAAQLMTPGTQQAIQQLTTNIATAFQNLAPAAAPLVAAFTEIAKVGSGALPGLAASAAQLAQNFSQFIAQKSATGELAHWLDEGLNTLKQLVPVVGSFAQAFMALAPLGQQVLPDISEALSHIDDLMPMIGAAALLLGPAFGPLEAGAKGAKAAADLIGSAFDALKPIILGVGNAVIPVFNNIGQAASDMLAPIRAAASLVGITIPDFKPIGPISFGSTGNGTPGVNRTALGGSTLPTAGLDPFTGLPLPASMGGLGSSLASNRSAEVSGWSGKPVFGSASGGGGGGSTGLPGAPALPYDTSLPAGYANLPQTAEIVSAENSWMDARHTLAEKQARVNQLEKDTTATADDITKAKNDVINAQQAQNQTELRLQDARQSLYDKANKQLDGYATQMGEIGAKLDQDLGISKGLPGLADNLVRFLGNLALAGPLAQMNALANAPGQAQGGYGLMGVLGAQGAFGSQYTAAGQAAAQASAQPSASAMGPSALQPGATSSTGGYAGDQALLANIPAGRYGREFGSDLTKGLGDCSSAVEDLVNLMQGRSTAGANMTTMNEAQRLSEMGLLPTNQPVPGALNVGFNAGHTQATLPGGTPFNWGNDPVAANGGVGGGGAWVPGMTSHYYLPMGAGAPSAAPDPYTPTPAPGGGGLYGPANTSPGLNNPPAPAGGGWGMPGLPSTVVGGAGQGPLMTPPGPGVGAGAGGPQLGGVEPYSNPSGGGFGITSGGMIDTAMSVAASAFPGLGQAAQTGMKLANRAIQFAGQATGIGIQGALDTFIPWGGSELASKNWITRGLGAAAGASPALPNMAGKAASAPKGQEGQGQQGGPGQPGGPVNQGVQIMGDYHQHGTEDQASADLSSHLTAQNTRPGP